MTKQEKAIREFCGHHADWWPSTTQVQEMLALAQPEQYPQIAISPEIVGYVAPQLKIEGSRHVICQCDKCKAQPEQEPVGQLLEDAFGRGQVMWFNKPKDESMLYTTPPQRTWVRLTDEEQQNISLEVPIDAVFITEAKLKEKNNG